MKDNNELEKGISTKTVILILILIFQAWLLIGILPFALFEDHHTSGLLGDTFGAVNSLFSALAFGGLIYTIFLQSTELKEQQKDLKETREVLARVASAQEKSEQALNQQADSLLSTAKLNALNALFTIYHEKAQYGLKYGIPSDLHEYTNKQDEVMTALESTLKELETKIGTKN